MTDKEINKEEQVDSMNQSQFSEFWRKKFNSVDFGSLDGKKIDENFCWAIIQSQLGAPLQKERLEDNQGILDKKGVPGIVTNSLLKEFGVTSSNEKEKDTFKLSQILDMPDFGAIVPLDRLASSSNKQVYVGLELNEFIFIAIKTHSQDYEGSQSLEHEASILRLLKGTSHIPQLLAHHTFSTYSLLVTHPVGIPLDFLVALHGPLSIDFVINCASQLIFVLRSLHSKQVFHRDISPSNIILCEQNQFYIIDFGISCRQEDSIEWKQKRIGTPLFMSRMIHNQFYKSDDDFEALTFTLVFLINGFCPWEPRSEIFYNQKLSMNKHNFFSLHMDLFMKVKNNELDKNFKNLLVQTMYRK